MQSCGQDGAHRTNQQVQIFEEGQAVKLIMRQEDADVRRPIVWL